MSDPDTYVIVTRLGLLSDDVGELKETLRQIATAVTRLALVEERQSQTNEALSRAFKQLDKLDGRLSAIERELPLQRKTSSWVFAAVSATAGAAILFIAKKVGLA